MSTNSISSNSSSQSLQYFTISSTHSENGKGKGKGVFSGIIKQLKCCFTAMNETQNPMPLTESYFAESYHSSGRDPEWERISDTEMKRALVLLMKRYYLSDDPYKTYGLKKPNALIAELLDQKDGSMSGHLLSDDEFLAIQLYTNSLYRPINHHLRYQPADDVPLVLNAMISGLDKLASYPSYRATGPLYRGIEKQMTEEEVQERFPLHGIYSDSGFMSASSDRRMADRFTGPVQLKIQPLTAVTISPFSMNPFEQEALFKPNTVFHVDGIQHAGYQWKIKLTEVSMNAVPDNNLRKKMNRQKRRLTGS